MLTEEKNEKRELLASYQSVQTEFNQKVESLLREKVGIERRYYLLLGFITLLLLLLARFTVTTYYL